MNVDFEIGAAREEELAKLAEIERACAELFPEEVLPVERRTDVVALGVLRRASDDATLWVARERAGAVIGYLVAEATEEELYLVQLDVRPDQQRQGIGRALVNRAVGAAAERGLAAVTLTTFASVRWNAPWYRKHGFAEVSGEGLTARLRRQLAVESAAGLKDRVAMRRAAANSETLKS